MRPNTTRSTPSLSRCSCRPSFTSRATSSMIRNARASYTWGCWPGAPPLHRSRRPGRSARLPTRHTPDATGRPERAATGRVRAVSDVAGRLPSMTYLTVKEIATRLAVNNTKVLRWINDGELRAIDVSSKPGTGRPRWRVSPEWLKAFEDGRSNRPPTPKPHKRRAGRSYITRKPIKEYV